MTAVLSPPMPSRTSRRPRPSTAPRVRDDPTADDLDLDRLAEELDAIRDRVLDSLGQDDAEYLRGILRLQRSLELGGRAALWVGIFPPAWLAGTAMLSLSKILENMEIGHNVMHGQWDWMRDDQIHSTTWEWDNVCPSRQWRHTHNHMHHQWTNVVGMDHDIGYGVIRIDESQRWHPAHLAQPLYFLVLAALFEYGVGLHDLSSAQAEGKGLDELRPKLLETLAQDPHARCSRTTSPSRCCRCRSASAGSSPPPPATWSPTWCATCGRSRSSSAGTSPTTSRSSPWRTPRASHAAAGTDARSSAAPTSPAGGLMNLLSGNLDHQIEHHLFPDLPLEPLRRDRARGPRGLRAPRPDLQHRLDAPAVRQRHPQGPALLAALNAQPAAARVRGDGRCRPPAGR